MAQRFRDLPEALANTGELALRLAFTLKNLGYRFPEFPLPPAPARSSTCASWRRPAPAGRYGEGPLAARARRQIAHELEIIGRLDLAGYFLIVWDIVEFCRASDILVQGRGSAANSAVCYALGITAVDPVGMDLLFERFLSEARGEWPDIDLDLPSGERREAVIQYVYRRYGRHGAGMTANVITYRGRSAAREVGKALGLPGELQDRLAHLVSTWGYQDPADVLTRHLAEAGCDPAPPAHPQVRRAVDATARPAAPPGPALGRHGDRRRPARRRRAAGAGHDAGPGGDPVGQGRLRRARHREGRPARAADDVGAPGLDRPGPRDGRRGRPRPPAPGRSRGVRGAAARPTPSASSRSRAAPRWPRCRGSIPRSSTTSWCRWPSSGRARSWATWCIPTSAAGAAARPVTYAHPSLEPILARTLGVPLFQEQLLRMAMVAAGFSGTEAEELRRAFGFKRSERRMVEIEAKLRAGMARQGIDGRAADEIVRAITAFALYGFPESHASSFALLAYASAWLKVRQPAPFYAALLNNQPMGFYHPATIVKDAQRHGLAHPADRRHPLGVGVRGRGGWPAGGGCGSGCATSRGCASPPAARSWRRGQTRPFASVADLAARAELASDEAQTLAAIGALRALGGTATGDLWAAAVPSPGPLFATGEAAPAPTPAGPLREMTADERLAADFAGTGVTLGPHPMALRRRGLAAAGVVRAADLQRQRDGADVRVAGSVIVRQRPGTAKGFVFLSLEDETGIANVIVTPGLFARHRLVLVTAPFLLVEGILQSQDGVVSVRAHRRDAAAGARRRDSVPRFRLVRFISVSESFLGDWPGGNTLASLICYMATVHRLPPCAAPEDEGVVARLTRLLRLEVELGLVEGRASRSARWPSPRRWP